MIQVKDLKKGQIVWECERGINIQLRCTEDARRVEEPERGMDGWSCMACVRQTSIGQVMTEEPETIELFQDIKDTAYGPKLYDEPQYITPGDLDQKAREAYVEISKKPYCSEPEKPPKEPEGRMVNGVLAPPEDMVIKDCPECVDIPSSNCPICAGTGRVIMYPSPRIVLDNHLVNERNRKDNRSEDNEPK